MRHVHLSSQPVQRDAERNCGVTFSNTARTHPNISEIIVYLLYGHFPVVISVGEREDFLCSCLQLSFVPVLLRVYLQQSHKERQHGMHSTSWTSQNGSMTQASGSGRRYANVDSARERRLAHEGPDEGRFLTRGQGPRTLSLPEGKIRTHQVGSNGQSQQSVDTSARLASRMLLLCLSTAALLPSSAHACPRRRPGDSARSVM